MAFLIGLGIIFVALCVVFLLVSPNERRTVRWLGFGVLVLSAPVSYWFGSFSNAFTDGICYSTTIDSIAAAVEVTSDPKALAARIRAMPLEGYETVCSSVQAAAESLPGATRSNPSLERP
jgi:hypothetical protein